MTDPLSRMSPASLAEARDRIAGCAIRTPLIRLDKDGAGPIFLKLENLQPIGSFKIRCAANALIARQDRLRDGVSTASAGNFAQGLAYAGRALGVPVTTYVPTTAAQSKIAGLQRLGATVLPVPYEQWWAMLDSPTDDPSFIHPVTDPDVLVGNGTIALEILEDLPEVARVIAPYGGGGLSVGIAAALRASGSQARTFASETEAGAPLSAALAAGEIVEVPFDSGSFVTGMGGPKLLPPMWPLARTLLAGSIEVSLAQTAEAIALLVDRHHVVAEGAGGAPVAAALAEPHDGPTVCIISGGHLDRGHLVSILEGRVP
nr:pyridoxal-phosphate dependent enzyme [Sphingomonas sp. Y57]